MARQRDPKATKGRLKASRRSRKPRDDDRSRDPEQGSPSDEGSGRDPESTAADEDLFVRGVLTRGEAAPEDQPELGPGQTHRVVKGKRGKRTVERRRFSTT
jgi:hypothetical protein